jgi:hypothetical protein
MWVSCAISERRTNVLRKQDFTMDLFPLQEIWSDSVEYINLVQYGVQL